MRVNYIFSVVMKELIRQLLNFPIVIWVKNKKPKYVQEAGEYLKVEAGDLRLLFTVSEVDKARERAAKNKEDFVEEIKII